MAGIIAGHFNGYNFYLMLNGVARKARIFGFHMAMMAHCA